MLLVVIIMRLKKLYDVNETLKQNADELWHFGSKTDTI